MMQRDESKKWQKESKFISKRGEITAEVLISSDTPRGVIFVPISHRN